LRGCEVENQDFWTDPIRARPHPRQLSPTLKVAKTIAPYAGYVDTLWTFATGKRWFAREVSIEYLIKDSRSDEALAAGADRRVGGSRLGKATLSNGGDVQNILEYWSNETVYRLCVNRGGRDCRRKAR